MHPEIPTNMRFNPPTFEVSAIAARIEEVFGLEGKWSPLDGERDQNFRLSCANAQQGSQDFVVKIAGPDEDLDITDFQVQALLYLQATNPELPVPRIVYTTQGNTLSELTSDNGVVHALRVVTYLPGIPYAEGEFPDAQNLKRIGAFQARMVKALAGFSHKASTAFMPWNLSNGIAVSEAMWTTAADDIKALTAPLIDRLRDEILPELNAGPSQIIHNDAHSYNLLRADAFSTAVVGLIDFGDMVYAPVVNEVAVMAANFQRGAKNDMSIMEHLLVGFHEEHPLSDQEVTLLWDAITLRLIITVLLSDIKLSLQSQHDPDVVADRVEAYELLTTVSTTNHAAAIARLRSVCGFS